MTVHIQASLQSQMNSSLDRKSSLMHVVVLPTHKGRVQPWWSVIWIKLGLRADAQVAKLGRGSLLPTYCWLSCTLSIIYARQCQSHSFTETLHWFEWQKNWETVQMRFRNLEGWVSCYLRDFLCLPAQKVRPAGWHWNIFEEIFHCSLRFCGRELKRKANKELFSPHFSQSRRVCLDYPVDFFPSLISFQH